MSINVSGNVLSSTGFTSSGDITNSPNVVTDGLVLWYDAGNNASYINSTNYYDCGYGCQYYASSPGCTNCNTQIKDMSGYGHDGNITGAAIGYSNIGGAIVFDGTTGKYVDTTISFGTVSNYSICFWARRDAESRMPISSQVNANFYWYGDSSWRYVHSGVGGEYYYNHNATISLGTWGYYCATYDGSNVNIYRQSVYEGQQATTGTADFSNGFRIGNWLGGAGYEYNGLITVVQIYNKALSVAEITQNFNDGRQRFGI